ncbi:unnamed protein product [Blepharisma stoltei]|uniref:P-type Ca(2+) transporter n=1 Tax=Blepharisma stoltei TaxID=1481888 RepID=A0AAU9IZ40_9CILI|nr:unnamed protein product [Blepharisma stoltei]
MEIITSRPLIKAQKFVSKEELIKLVDIYMDRTFDEDIQVIEETGGIKEFENLLMVEFSQGLKSDEDPSERISHFGSNKKTDKEPPSFWKMCWQIFKDKILITLSVLGFISLVIGATLAEHPEYGWIEGFSILVSVVVIVLVTAINDYKKEKKFFELQSIHKSRQHFTILRDGSYKTIHPDEILVGDILKIDQGCIIPVDGVIITSHHLQVNEASLTGENDNLHKASYEKCIKKIEEYLENNVPGPNSKHDIPSPICISGTNVVEGAGEILVIAVGENSKEGRIKGLSIGEDEISPLKTKIDNLISRISNVAIAISFTSVFVLYIRFFIELGVGTTTWDTDDGIRTLIEFVVEGIIILVVSIPEGLPLTVTLTLAYAVKKMQQDHNLVKKIRACEIMGGADTICSDKTGTLTKNEMEVKSFSINAIIYQRSELSQLFQNHDDYLGFFKDAISLTTTARIDEDKREIGSKTELAMIKFLDSLGITDYQFIRDYYKGKIIAKNPFSSVRKRSSIIIQYNEDIKRIYVLGASEYILSSCTHTLTPQATINRIRKIQRTKSNKDINEMASEGLRTIGLAFKDLSESELDQVINIKNYHASLEETDLVLIGVLGIYDPPRDEVQKAIEDCKAASIKVRMVTGDNKDTAFSIAKSIGIANKNSLVLSGEEFRKEVEGIVCEKHRTEICECQNSKGNARIDVVGNIERFKEIIDNLDVLARSQPEDKYILVTGLKQLGHVVAVTGDGTNDAPALKKANIGFAMGISGTEMAREAADIILLDDNFSSIVKAVLWGRSIYENIQRFLQFQLSVNLTAVVVAIVGVVSIKSTVLTAVQLLWVNLIMNTFASLALATESPSESLLTRKPNSPKDSIITNLMYKHIFGQSFLQISVILAMVFAGEWFLPEYGNTSDMSVLVNPDDSSMVRSGRPYHLDGSKDYIDFYDDPDYGPSRHFTYIFNIFVLFQLFNEINSRKLRDEWWIFSNIRKSKFFIPIWLFTFVVQVIMVEFGSIAMSCHQEGLTVEQWFICVAWASSTLVWRFVLLLIPPFNLKSRVDEENG